MTEGADRECVEHGLKVTKILERINSMNESVMAVAAYVPKIEVALERLANVQDILRSYADIHKELFKLQRESSERLSELTNRVTVNEGRLTTIEDQKDGAMSIMKPIIAGALLAMLGYIALSVLHALGQKVP